jgi:ribosomal protein S26
VKRYYRTLWGRKARQAKKQGMANPVQCKGCGEVFDYDKRDNRTKHRKHSTA